MKTKKAAANGRAGEAKHGDGESEVLAITRPNIRVYKIPIVGTAPLVMNRFNGRTRQLIKETQQAGSQAKSKRKRDPKDFDALYEGAIHRSTEGWYGFPAAGFRAAMIDACRLVGFKMTVGKLAIFVRADGWEEDGTALVRIEGEPHYFESVVRNESGVIDIRARPKFAPGWGATVQVEADGDQFSMADVANLLSRAGAQCGIGEGRHNSKNSFGQGWGTFAIVEG
jgi:hypothetical protein